MSEKASWGLSEGDEIAPRRTALRRLGGGKRYEVYLAWDERLHSKVVAKVLRPDQTSDSAALRAMKREARALRRLAHPSIVRRLDAVLDGPRPQIVLEHLDASTLRRAVYEGGPIPVQPIVDVAIAIASALHYMAEAGWVHLDVKPANIVLTSPPRLIDLSLARTLERARALRSPVGTRRYMSPEQSEPATAGPAGPPADVWGLGLTLYEAFAGRLPESGGRNSFLRASRPCSRGG